MAPFSAAFVASSRTRAALAGLRSHEGGISRAQAIPITLKFRKVIAIKKTALTRLRRLVVLDPATSRVPIPRRTRELAECAPGQRAVA